MTLSPGSVKELQAILEKQLARPVSIDEAGAIGVWLLEFYGRLAKSNTSCVFTEVKNDIIKEHTT